MLPIILGVLSVSVIGFLGFVATRPDTFRIQRATRINAPPEKVFPQIADFRNWSAWSPWEKLDPNLQRTMSGSASGKGSIYEWEGNAKAGKGRMEITEATMPRKVVIDLQFIKPFAAHNTTEFALHPLGDATDVTWAMTGSRPFMIKLMGVFMSMDELVGKDFEKGLAAMKEIVERA